MVTTGHVHDQQGCSNLVVDRDIVPSLLVQ